MRYSQLRAFHHVARNGGFSAAAQALNQSQPTLSEQVRQLEQAHDVLLFHRDGRQIRLTEQGEGLYLLTRHFFEVEGNIAEFLDRSRAVLGGTMRILADSAMHITPAISRFRQMHPQVFVSIGSGNTEEVLARLRRYDAEIGVVGNLADAPDLDCADLGRTPIVAVAARDLLPPERRSIRFAELQNWPLIFRETGSRTRRGLEEEAARRQLRLRPVIEVEGREAMREVVAAGAGIGFVTQAEFGHDNRLVPLTIAGIDLGMTETLVSLKARRDVPVIRAFLKVVEGLAKPGSGSFPS